MIRSLLGAPGRHFVKAAIACGAVALCAAPTPASAANTAGKIAYDFNGAIYARDSHGHHEVQLTHARGQTEDEAATSRAGKLVYTRFSPHGPAVIMVTNSKRTKSRQLTMGRRDVRPAISPDGERIVFMRRHLHGTKYDLFTIHSDGSHLRRLLSGHDLRGPTFVRDGDRILYTHQADVWAINFDGSHKHSAFRHTRIRETEPDLSPDGNRIAFVETKPGHNHAGADQGDIYIAHRDGSHRQAVASTRHSELSPEFSPSGNRIAFTRTEDNRHGSGDNIFTIRVDGTGLRRITGNRHNAFNEGFYPAWIPFH